MNDQPAQELFSGAEVSPSSLKIEHESSVQWHTWGLIRRDTDNNYVMVEIRDISDAATVAMQMNIFGVDAPKMGEWWLNAGRKAKGEWKAEVVPVRPHPNAAVKITPRAGVSMVSFDIELPTDSALYTQGYPYWTLKVYANAKIDVGYGRGRLT
jgi:hypothetical protein